MSDPHGMIRKALLADDWHLVGTQFIYQHSPFSRVAPIEVLRYVFVPKQYTC
jgi:hypothetical protein